MGLFIAFLRERELNEFTKTALGPWETGGSASLLMAPTLQQLQDPESWMGLGENKHGHETGFVHKGTGSRLCLFFFLGGFHLRGQLHKTRGSGSSATRSCKMVNSA